MIAEGTADRLAAIAAQAKLGFAVDAVTGDVFAPGAELPPGRSLYASVRIQLPAAANGPGKALDVFAALSGTGWRLEFLPRLVPALDRSLGVVRARPEDLPVLPATVADGSPPHALDGSGVLLGVVDFGCDFAHPAFLDDSGRTRLRFLWDQNAPATGRVPGAIREQGEIDAALQKPDPYQALGYRPDENCYLPAVAGRTQLVHGTHVLGVAAGRGVPDCPAGVAPGATLAFVHLRPGAMVTSGDPADVFDGVCAIFYRAEQLGLPAVVNLSLGANWGSHDGNTLYDCALDALLTRPGRAIAVAAGNERQASLNVDGQVVAGSPLRLGWRFKPGDRTQNTVRIFSEAPAGVRLLECSIQVDGVAVASPMPAGANAQPFVSGALEGVIYSGLAPTRGSAPLQQIEVLVRPSGVAEQLDIVLSTTSASPVSFDAWIDRDDRAQASQSCFDTEPPITRSTLACTACGRRTLCVGAFAHRVPELAAAAFSAEGLTRDGRRKPDVSAPGLDVLAAAAYGGRVAPGQPWRNALCVRMTGSSAASPHGAGIQALMLQRSPGLAAEDGLQILRETARFDATDATDAGWHKQLGYGRIDAAAALARLGP